MIVEMEAVSEHRDVKIWLAIVLGSAVSMAVLWFTAIPLGIPGEWTWERVAAEPDTFWNRIGGAVAAAIYLLFVILGCRRFNRLVEVSPSRREMLTWLIGLVVFAFAWIWVVQEV